MGVFRPGAVLLQVEVCRVAFAGRENQTSANDLPTGRIEDHHALVTAGRRERRLEAAGSLRVIVECHHASRILATLSKNEVAAGDFA